MGAGISALTGCLAGRSALGLSSGAFEERRVTAARVVKEPVEYDVSLRVDVLEPAFVAAHPAELRVHWENAGSSTTPFVGLECRPPNALWSIARDFERKSGAVLLSADQRPERSGASDCWTLPGDHFVSACGSAGGQGVSLAPRGSIRQTFTLWDEPGSEGCLPPGTYYFGHSNPFPYRGTRPDAPDFEWLFAVDVEESTE